MRSSLLLVASCMVVVSSSADSCLPVADAASPDGRNAIRLYVNPLSYSVERDGVTVVERSEIGLTVNGRVLRADGAPKVAKRILSGKVATPVYKRGEVDLAGGEALVDFDAWAVRLVARNDGVAYRFETRLPGEVTVDAERVNLTAGDQKAPCWFNFGNSFGCEETVSQFRPIGEITTVDGTNTAWSGGNYLYLPIVYRVGGKAVAFTEADVSDYPVLNLMRSKTMDKASFSSLFAGWPKVRDASSGRWVRVRGHEGYLVRTAGTRTFPWRTFVLCDSCAQLCESDIVLALAKPVEAGADFSWVRPGKVAWDWWNCFDNADKDAPNRGCTTKTYERFIDFASAHGVEYVIFDEGWSKRLNIWEFHPQVDVPHLIDYAKRRNVGIILWMAWAQVVGKEEVVARHFKKLGAVGFKVDFMDRGDAEVTRFLEKFASVCAKERLLVDYHGVYRPTGLHRRYPNVINYEGVHGLEQMKWFGGKYDFMANDVRLYYCRMTAGPMDYTPGAMLNFAKGTYDGHKWNYPGSYGTRSRQMAMMVAFEAPLQMLCDSPTNYERNMESFRFMAAVPTTWNRTVGLGGDPESYVAVARQAKDGSWYAAGFGNWNRHEVRFKTSFLGDGAWDVEEFRDAADSDVKAEHYVHGRRQVNGGVEEVVRLSPGGGFVIRYVRKMK